MADEPVAVPPEVKAHWVPGKITIVEVVDFECDHCRRMHNVLTAFLGEQGEGIHFVRVVAPMEKHKHARDAARAYLCAVEQNKGDEMAEKLFAANDLTPEACERLAVSLGISRERYRTCVASPKIEEQIKANVAWVDKASPRGLPCMWVQDQGLFGEQSDHELKVALTKAEQSLRAGGQ
jgi:predicted DsbA family dithiol-disulfide isomerase